VPERTIAAPAGAAVTITVSVDLTAWELEKIEAFLRLLGVVPGRSEPSA
jgi:hypothetical protein